MKIKELRELSTEELNTKISDNKKELLNMRMKQAVGTLEKPSQMRELKKDIARMKTIIRERELAGGTTDGE